MISEVPSYPRCIVKIQSQELNSREQLRSHHHGPITAPKPRLFPMNSPQSQLRQPPPPSPPLPPPPPPASGPESHASTSSSVPMPQNVRSTTTTTVVNSRPSNGASYIAVNDHHHHHSHDVSQTFEKTPSPSIRRSLSGQKDHPELSLKPENLKTRQERSSEELERPPRHSTSSARHQVLVRKPGNLFLAQLYFLFHLALTICLLRANGSTKKGNRIFFHETVLYYYSYLLGTSILFIVLIRCCKNDDFAHGAKIKARNTAVLLGSIALGLIQLIAIGLDFAQCFSKYYIFLPMLQFLFVFLLMHFVLTQARHGPKLGFSNIAVAHLLATQVSLWIINFDPNYGPCGYSDRYRYNSNGSNRSVAALELVEKRTTFLPFANLLLPVIHHYQLLTIFILTTMWFMNNDMKLVAARATGGASYDESSAYNFFKKKASIKGFFLGLLVISAAIIVLILQDNMMSLIAHTAIQGLSAVVAMTGLVLRGKKTKPLYKSPVSIAAPKEGQLIVYVTILATYYCAILMIMSNVLGRTVNVTAICDGIVMIIHITFQTFLLRSGDREKINRTREIFAFLILANFSLWLLEVSQVAMKAGHLGPTDILLLPPLLMSLNRFYSALVFIQFWRSK